MHSAGYIRRYLSLSRFTSNRKQVYDHERFPIFLVGYLILIAGVGYGMHAAGIAPQWIITAVLILAGVGVIGSLSRARRGSSDADAPE